MDEITRETLTRIYDAAKNTSDGYTMGVSIDIRSDTRQEVCSWLESQGYITKVELFGQDKVRCQVTEKTYRFFMSACEDTLKHKEGETYYE